MRVFLDTSVLLAACGSARGASREVFRRATANAWTLLATPYVIEEVFCKLPALPMAASSNWIRLRADWVLLDDIITLDRPAVFLAAGFPPCAGCAAACLPSGRWLYAPQ
jgi:predicted nucleic acid-binding protein